MSRAVLTPNGWELPAASDWTSKNFSASGFATSPTQPGVFGQAIVHGVSGGTSPAIEIRNGGPNGELMASVAAAPGATIDRLADPDRCPAGVYLNVIGDPGKLDVTVRYRQG